MDWLFPFLCHQIPERTPHLAGETFPLCFRCGGTYLGFFVAYGYLALSGGFKRSLPRIPALMVGSMLMLPFLIDGWANTLHVWDSPGWLRLLTGLGMGTLLPLLLVPIAAGNIYPNHWERFPSTLPTAGHLCWPLLSGALLASVLILTESPRVFHALSVAVQVGALFFWGTFLAALINLGRVLPAWWQAAK